MPGPRHMGKPQEKVKDFKGTLKRFLGLLKPYKSLIVVAFISAFIGILASNIAPKVLGNFTTAVALFVKSGVWDWNVIKSIVIKLAALYIISPIFRFMQHYWMVGISSRVVRDLRGQINTKLDKLPLKYFDSRTQGEIMSRLTNDVDKIDESLQEGITQAINSFFTIICILVMMFTTNVVLTLVSLVVVPITMAIIMVVIKNTQKFFLANQKFLGDANGHVEQYYGGHSIVKTFNYEAEATKEFDRINDELYTAGWKSNFYSSVIHPLTQFTGNLGYILVVVVGALYVNKGILAVGVIQSFIQYVKRFNQPIQEVANISNVFQSTLAAAERIFEVLDETEEIDDGKKSVDPAIGHVEFKDVFFSYNADKKLIENFNVDIKPGTKIAIVGPTGAGKTTIVNLLMRFYDVDSGSILVDSIDVKDWPRDVLRDQFGMVLQDTWLFEGTIAENIAYGAGTKEVNLDRVKECAERACADHFIETLSGGYDFVVNEEASNVSQGEKQLLTIARAFMSDPRILILDEATSNVDTRTERLVQKAMENLMENRTSFIIAHRLSTIRDADLILVIKDGNIVEKGKHNELLNMKGFYYELYMSQFKGAYTEEES